MPAFKSPANEEMMTRRQPLRLFPTVMLMLPVLVAALLLAGCGLFSSDEDEPQYEAGETYFGRNNYIEYTAGDLPIILSAPHGGYEEPDEIPNRVYGNSTHHPYTQELVRAIASAINSRTGGRVHLIINRLRRTKLDANHTELQGAEGNEWAKQAWNEYHNFILAASRTVEQQWQRGFYIDVHGHPHTVQRLELGYITSAALLKMSDRNLNDWEYRDDSSIRTLAKEAAASFVELLRGPISLGTLLEGKEYPAIPSTNQPDPRNDEYWSGEWCVKWYGSRDDGPVSAVQLSCNMEGVRDSEANRTAFAQALAEVLETFIETHYGFDLQAGPRY